MVFSPAVRTIPLRPAPHDGNKSYMVLMECCLLLQSFLNLFFSQYMPLLFLQKIHLLLQCNQHYLVPLSVHPVSTMVYLYKMSLFFENIYIPQYCNP